MKSLPTETIVIVLVMTHLFVFMLGGLAATISWYMTDCKQNKS